ncbi:hypothetical protein SPRG_17140 [Saprolegnia parasitica CBS 223.65]|uniref:Uncharacterized protein n=1 Tax=Saprolegnia parasitica (strain CBS 223.65) TaxID=695850 RepID=A0A067BGA9_SAPPC|nr:hypothetical protein SPRG_17140 [Saprolegnia parasitica CBS 223.65]KDO17439.1 hypothetical protein SPRG_17140 [Saprolegnia parasitica CBS 223.65]|eukprot:XP_012211854.1 hypothetical protein SPRG_17140 [Saprolegnia parasitica CBS 223.65]
MTTELTSRPRDKHPRRLTPDAALLSAELLEAIATYLPVEGMTSFLDALPEHLRTPALELLATLSQVLGLQVLWPTLDLSVLVQLADADNILAQLLSVNPAAQKAARVTLTNTLALPHVMEAIATSLDNQEDLESFLYAIPRSLWTPALTAFLDCTTVMPYSIIANWPHIKLRSIRFRSSILTLLAATLPLRPRIELRYAVRDTASLVAVVGPALSCVILGFYSGRMVQGRGRAISNLLLQRCPRLRQVSISVISYSESDAAELNGLLAVVAHPHVIDLSLDLLLAITVPRLGHLLASWLSTAPATKLTLVRVAQMDDDAMMAFCDALQGNTTLQELTIVDIPSLNGFHGRTLPVSLKILNVYVNGVVDAATLTSLANAVGPTQLERLECSVFGSLATCPAAAPMLSQLQSLVVSRLHVDNMPALLAGLSSVPALTSLELCDYSLSLSTELLMETLATTCMHLETLRVSNEQLTRDGATAVLSGVLQLPRLTTLDLWMPLLDVIDVLPELVAAGRHLRRLSLMSIERPNDDLEKRAIYEALAQVPNVPFVLQTLPKDMDKFVVDALSRRADRRHHCDLAL